MSAGTVSADFRAASLASRPWWPLGAFAAGLAVVANLIVYAVAEGVAGLNLQVPNQQTGGLMDLGPAPVALLSAVPAVVATLLAAALHRWTAAPRRWFLILATVVLIASFAPTLLIGVPASTTLTLALMHVVAAAAIVRSLLPGLPDRR